MKIPKAHLALGDSDDVLCKEPRWHAAVKNAADAEHVTCLRCLFLLGRYFPTDTTPERREELIERAAKLPRT